MNYGEIISLGRHRLMCGDATKREDVEKLIAGEHVDLVLTDPPYGIKIHANYHRFKGSINSKIPRKHEQDIKRYTQEHYKQIIGDNTTEAARNHYEIIKNVTDKIIMWGGIYFTDFLPVSKCWLIWNKEQKLPNHAEGKMAWTNIKDHVRIYRQLWNGCIRQGSNMLNPKPSMHLSQKPVELHMNILEDYSSENAVVLDCFGGSGTTLIACEMTGRKCLMMKLSPEYCDIIKGRYEKITQQLTFDF